MNSPLSRLRTSALRMSVLMLIVGLVASCGGGGGSSRSTPITSNPTPPATATVGLSSRPNNASCTAPARTLNATGLALTDAFPSLPNLAQPVKIIQPPNDSSTWFAVGRGGALERFSSNGTTLERYLDLSVTATGEGGFLSAALHPDCPASREIYVSYTLNDGGFKSRLSRLVITDDNTLPAAFVEEVLLTIDQPFTNHNGGDLTFGPDGSLYYGLGDGGDSGDPQDNAQNTSRLLGSILRLDVNGIAFPSPGYNIPTSNPFAGNAKCGPGTNANACPEIYAWGLRNPWRMSFDQSSGVLWVGDVGQGTREEVDIITLGSNYGWRCREGTLAFNTSACPSGPFEEPVHDYGRSAGDRSITGGYVYRGSAVDAFVGKYLFADYSSGRIWSLEDQGGRYFATELLDTDLNIAGLSQGNDGEVYVLDIATGRVLQFTATGNTMADNVPDNLTDTGCFAATDPSQPASGLIPYEPAAPFWSDGAEKSRWIALPNGGTIDATNAAQWNFPTGTVIAKHFELASQLIETRLYMRHPDGDWAGYSYQWDDAQTTASRVRTGATRNVGGQTWVYPSESDCASCHTQVAGRVLGLETAQLNTELTYPSTNVSDNQLEVFNHIGLFATNIAEPVAVQPALVDPADSNAALDERARAYLHTNCAQCHQPGGPTGMDLDLRFDTALAATNTCNATPQAGDLGINNARLLTPGDSAQSVLIQRVSVRGSDAMPPLGSNVVDTAGVQLLTDWVNSLTSCP